VLEAEELPPMNDGYTEFGPIWPNLLVMGEMGHKWSDPAE